MAIGPTLQEARLKKQLTPSQVAELTRMKVQIVNDLEKDDFHRMPATIYCKGFIKLFAECVDLDPQPLIADYIRSIESKTQPSLIPYGVDNNAPQPEQAAEAPTPPKPASTPDIDVEAPAPEPEAGPPSDLFSYAKTRRVRVVSDSTTPHSTAIKNTISTKANAVGAQAEQRVNAMAKACRSWAETIGTRLTEIHWGDAPLKVIGIVIAVLVVLLFVVSGISSCIGPQDSNTAITSELHLAVDPPEPYFD